MLMTFECTYQILSNQSPEWGRVALLPWDEKIFGFPVADLRLGSERPKCEETPEFRAALDSFCMRTKARLVSTRADARDTSTIGMLSKAGFLAVEFSFKATLPRIKLQSLPPRRYQLRLATPEDHFGITEIARKAFLFGRYHTDPRFPRELANRRYVHWVLNALNGTDQSDLVFVLGPPGGAIGFMEVIVRDGKADLRLGAVDPERNSGLAGFSLYAETLRALLEMGTKSASAKIAAANTAVLNVCASLGFRFSQPETVLHWHAPDFPTHSEK
jgi:RimJ/RimL family protein N-acetyltransferase